MKLKTSVCNNHGFIWYKKKLLDIVFLFEFICTILQTYNESTSDSMEIFHINLSSTDGKLIKCFYGQLRDITFNLTFVTDISLPFAWAISLCKLNTWQNLLEYCYRPTNFFSEIYVYYKCNESEMYRFDRFPIFKIV